MLSEVQKVDSSQRYHHSQQHHSLNHARGHLLYNEEGHYQCCQHKYVITNVSHKPYLNIFLNSVGTGVSNSIGSPVTG